MRTEFIAKPAVRIPANSTPRVAAAEFAVTSIVELAAMALSSSFDVSPSTWSMRGEILIP